METNIVALCAKLSRVYEIAKAGDFTITVIFENNHEYPQGLKDYETVKEFYNDVKFVVDGDIFVELVKPHPNKYKSSTFYENLSDIQKRVETAKNSQIPKNDLCSACWQFLEKAIDKLQLSIQDIEIIKKIAVTIAQLDSSEKIESWHIAEAIQYRAKSFRDDYVIGENALLKFGDFISFDTVGLTSIYNDPDNIKKAIEYLQKLINT